jgi:hypothetical protein
MLRYFMGRVAAGITTFLLASLVLYSSLVPLMVDTLNAENSQLAYVQDHVQLRFSSYLQMYSLFKLDRPWPLNYLTWLYDPINGGVQSYTLTGKWGGIYYQDDTLTYIYPGLLTGNLGSSITVQSDTPVLTLFGLDRESLASIYLLWVSLISAGIAVASWQRKGRTGNRAWPRRAIFIADGPRRQIG